MVVVVFLLIPYRASAAHILAWVQTDIIADLYLRKRRKSSSQVPVERSSSL